MHCVSLAKLAAFPKGAIGVDEKGIIQFTEKELDLEGIFQTHPDWKDAKVVKVEDGFFFPGFVGKPK